MDRTILVASLTGRVTFTIMRVMKAKTVLYSMFVFVPVSFWLGLTHASPVAVFAVSCLAILPLAGIMGEATESLAHHAGPGMGGLLNATFGNAAELIIAFMALRAGETEIVKASLTGSIIGNMLMVLGPLHAAREAGSTRS